MKNRLTKTQSGFTIIEVMVSITLFLVIVTTGMAALLNVNLLSQKSRDMRSVMDSLSFAMDDMSKSLRTGYDYYCFNYNGGPLPSGAQSPQDCASGGSAISFKPQDYITNNEPLVYYFYTNPSDSTKFSLFKATDGSAASAVQLTPNNVLISQASFVVTGAPPPPGDVSQPYVTIKLSGSIVYNKVSSPFSLETSVSQRLLDNK